jgi:quinolinate synthase
MNDGGLLAQIERLKRQKKAIILSHFYQRPEIQDIADYVGDSFGLSQQAAQTDADVIVFCGVRFMAEVAAILSPGKIVLLPESEAGCPMADMADAESLRSLKKQYPEAAVVSYVNTSAEVKAESDVCCTSANVLKVVNSMPQRQIIFVPDRNMGQFVAARTEKEIILWQGYCYVHDHLGADDVLRAKQAHAEALVMVHPECSPAVAEIADYVTGTTGMLKLARTESANTFIVGTEIGLEYALKKAAPGKDFIFPNPDLSCFNMKLTTLAKVADSLEKLGPQVSVPAHVAARARLALERMLTVY